MVYAGIKHSFFVSVTRLLETSSLLRLLAVPLAWFLQTSSLVHFLYVYITQTVEGLFVVNLPPRPMVFISLRDS